MSLVVVICPAVVRESHSSALIRVPDYIPEYQKVGLPVLGLVPLNMAPAGTRAGHQNQLLGYSVHSDVSVEPYLITLEKESEVIPILQHAGIEFIYILQGIMVYRHLNETY